MATSEAHPPLPAHLGTITSSQLIGTLLNFFLFGILFVQVYVYKLCFPKDRPAIKALVYSMFLIMLLCTCLNAADANRWWGDGFGDLLEFSRAGFSPFYTPIMGSVIALAVQLFYCYRISVFRESRGSVWWSAAIAVVSLIQAAGGVGGGVKAFIASNEQHDHARVILVYLWLVGDAVADVMIAVTMTYLLSQASEPQTRDVVQGVIRLIIETNAFSASVAIIGLVLFAGMPGTDYFICPTMILPGIYANTLLVLLNNRATPARSRIKPDYRSRSTDADVVYGSDGTTTTANGTSLGHMWKTMPTSPGVQLQKLDYGAPTKRVPVPKVVDIGPGAFVAAPNAAFGVKSEDYDLELEDTKRDFGYDASAYSSTPSPPQHQHHLQPRRQPSASKHLRSEWDDASYKTGDRDLRARWDDRDGADGASMDLTEVETHPYGSAGTYTTWAR
ncbi:hypothetical protein C8F01DRAFT_1257494 [Mycena amicta]|nr:hypothetical protein C8F01DRAFT_1257494 [Mycena amicta]